MDRDRTPIPVGHIIGTANTGITTGKEEARSAAPGFFHFQQQNFGYVQNGGRWNPSHALDSVVT